MCRIIYVRWILRRILMMTTAVINNILLIVSIIISEIYIRIYIYIINICIYMYMYRKQKYLFRIPLCIIATRDINLLCTIIYYLRDIIIMIILFAVINNLVEILNCEIDKRIFTIR